MASDAEVKPIETPELAAPDAAAQVEAQPSHAIGSSTSHDQINGSTTLHGVTPCSRKAKEEVGWRRIVRNFTPSWFAVNMGTGIVSVLIHNLPYNGAWLHDISYIFFVLNIVLFVCFNIITFLRYTLYPEIWLVMVRHPAQSMFLGCYPMGLATIINMIVLSLGPWGTWTVYLAWGLWWYDVILSLGSLFLMFPIFQSHHLELKLVNGTLLLPFVPCVVASGTGALVAGVLPSAEHAQVTLIVSYVLWGIGEAFTVIILSMYFQRLCLHSLPPRTAIVSVFLPVGPLGQGGFAIQQMGRVALDIFPQTGAWGTAIVKVDPALIGQIFYATGILIALLMWGAGFVWLVLALATIIRMKFKGGFPFNMGWWGFTFPLGVFTTCTGNLAEELGSGFLKVLTTIFSVSVLLFWIMVAIRTVLKAITGEIFFAPCLKDLRPEEQEQEKEKCRAST